MKWNQQFTRDGVPYSKISALRLKDFTSTERFSCTLWNEGFYYLKDGVLCHTPQLSSGPHIVHRSSSVINTGSEYYSGGIYSLGATADCLIAQLNNGDIGFLNYTSAGLTFTPQLKGYRIDGELILHDQIFYSHISGHWYGFNVGRVYQYSTQHPLSDSLVDPFFRAFETSLANNEIWAVTEVSGKPFWYGGSSEGTWSYYNGRRRDVFTEQPNLGVFSGYLWGYSVLICASYNIDSIEIDVVSTSLYSYNTTTEVDFIQGRQLAHNTGMVTSSTKPNLLLHNAKVLDVDNYNYTLKVTLFTF